MNTVRSRSQDMREFGWTITPRRIVPAKLGSMQQATRDTLVARCRGLIERLSDGTRDDQARDALLLDIAAWQARHVAPYGRLLQRRDLRVADVSHPSQLPAVPTDLFRFTRVAAHGPERDIRVFRTSGTTSGRRGEHALCDLSLYRVSARSAAGLALFCDGRAVRLVSLVPREADAPDSSLSYMIGRFYEWFGDGKGVHAWRQEALDVALLCRALDDAVAEAAPVALMGTSFALQHAEDELGQRRWRLPEGSRIMYTGGFKGRAREVDPEVMRAHLVERYGVAASRIVGEYGMTELSSQLYEATLWSPPAARPGIYRAPPWLRISVVHPESLQPVAAGQRGLLRVEDPANVDTAWAIQTSDVARCTDDSGAELELFGRSPEATPRGCSLAVEEALATGR